MRFSRTALCLFVVAATAQLLLTPTHAFGQFVVDCTGNTPGAYTTINSVVPQLTNGSVVRITGPCTENVTIAGLSNLNIGAPYGQTAALNGNLSINGVQNLYLYGMNVSNPNGDGIDVSNSTNITLAACTSNNNSSNGLNVQSSTVAVQDIGAFNNNGADGIYASGSTGLQFDAYGGPITLNSNQGNGIYLEDGVMTALGNIFIENNAINPNNVYPSSTGTGFGINFWGHARAVFYSYFGPDVITGNQAGGVAIHEGSEISLSGPDPSSSTGPWTTTIQSNGPIGVMAGYGSQVTIWGGVQISNHTDTGVDIYGHSQVFINGIDQISGNGSGSTMTDPQRAGLRVDGNSEAYIRGSLQVSQNAGPGILELDNSSVDVSGATFTSNAGGSIVCDSSAWLVSDQSTPPAPSVPAQATCRMPHLFGPIFRPNAASAHPPLSGIDRFKAQEARYKQLISSF